MAKAVSKALRRATPLGLTPMALSLAACGSGGEDSSSSSNNDIDVPSIGGGDEDTGSSSNDTDVPSTGDSEEDTGSSSNDTDVPSTGVASISLIGNRGDYNISKTADGYSIVNENMVQTQVQSGQINFSDGGTYLLRDTANIIANAKSHLENYTFGQSLFTANVQWLHTASWWVNTETVDIFVNPQDLLQYPSLGENNVVTAYINISEITGVGDWDPHWNNSWDVNGDDVIDVDVSLLPSYLQGLDFVDFWGNYVVNYWEPEWKEVLFEKIDMVMSQNFDGVMFDCVSRWNFKTDTNPNALADMVSLVIEVTNYIHEKYGNTALATFNMDPQVLIQYPELANIIDGVYQQNSYLNWTGDGQISSSFNAAETTAMAEIMSLAGKTMFVMDHIDTPTNSIFLDFMILSAQSGVIPMISSLRFEDFESYPIYRFSYDGQEEVVGWEYTDYFWSGVGSDMMAGAGGADTYVFAPGSVNNMILDFNPENDRLVFLDEELNIPSDLTATKELTIDGDLEVSSISGASVVLVGCDLDSIIDVYNGVLV